MCVLEPDAVGQHCIAALCGAVDTGNLRVIHAGVDVSGGVPMSLSLHKPHSLWVLRGNIVIVLSAGGNAITLDIARDGSAAALSTHLPGYADSIATLCCCDLGDVAVRVSPTGVFKFQDASLVHHTSGDSEVWRPSSGRITSAAGDGRDSLIISSSDGKLEYFMLRHSSLQSLTCCTWTVNRYC